MPEQDNSVLSMRNLLAAALITALGGTGIGVSVLNSPAEPVSQAIAVERLNGEIAVLEARVEILWEAEKSRVAQQIGERKW